MTDTVPEMLHDTADALDPLADVDEGVVKNRAKVGSARPSSLLYTYGPGAIMDLPGSRSCPQGSMIGSRSGNAASTSRPSSSHACSGSCGCTSAPGRRAAALSLATETRSIIQRG